MNGYLLDTSVALLARTEPERLPHSSPTAIREGPAFLSILLYWEIMIKSRKGALEVGDALIARASVENLTLVTTDRLLKRYASAHFRVLD